DDDPSIRKAFKRLLLLEGFEVETFESAEDFLEVTHPRGKICLVLDLRLPGMSGLQLLQALEQSGRKIPTIIITAHDEENTRRQVLKSGATLLIKPIQDQALLNAVRKALS